MGEPAAGPQAGVGAVLRAATGPLARAGTTLASAGTYAAQARHVAASNLREAAAAAVTVGLWPLGVAAPRVEAAPPAVGVPVLLVHGYGANRSNWRFVERRLRAGGFTSVHAANYNPLTSDLPGLAEWLATEVATLRARCGVEAVHVVGHSLGGVVARYAVQVLGLEGVATCVTLASPHGGVTLARPVPTLPGGLGAVARQLRPDAPEMVLLRSSARPLGTRFVAVAGGSDVIVPTGRALIREPELAATNLVIANHGHFSLLFSAPLADSLVHQLGLGRSAGWAPTRLPSAA